MPTFFSLVRCLQALISSLSIAAHLHSCWGHITTPHRKQKPRWSVCVSSCISFHWKKEKLLIQFDSIYLCMYSLSALDSFDLTLNKCIVHTEKNKNLISASHIDSYIQPAAWVHMSKYTHFISVRREIILLLRDNNSGVPFEKRYV